MNAHHAERKLYLERQVGLKHIEALESRRLLSATAAFFHKTLAADSTDIQGFTPSQVSKAYGFDTISFSNGGIKGDGTGQTIAVVDAFNDRKVVSDLAVFDQKFNLPAPPTLKVVNQTGGSILPANNAGWASEIALDVEWVHAVAPQANLLLVESRNGSEASLLAATRYAASAPGVSVVSMSWGFNESVSQLKMDQSLLTPAGHAGVTFVTAAGDNGAAAGAGWPASSPSVLSVGGTNLTLDSSGNYGSERSWSDTGGGYSRYEAEPSYQQTAQQSGARSTPDVAYDADPNTGFAVYDSIPYQGATGWQEIAGNSAGAPQWAAIVAIANQGRATNGLAPLDGLSQTLPSLYSVYAPAGSSGNSAYTADFHDVEDAGDNRADTPATLNYDTATGLGSPKASQIVDLLVADPSTTPSSSVSLSATFFGSQPIIVSEGHQGSATLVLTNLTGTKLAGSAQINVYASNDSYLDASDTLLINRPTVTVHLGRHRQTRIQIHFVAPKDQTPGTYYLLASMAISPLTGGQTLTDVASIGTSSADANLGG